MKYKHFAALEIGADCESPMVGVVNNITNNKQGLESFKLRLIDAIGEHFDSDDIHFKNELPDRFAGSPFEDIEITVSEDAYKVRILETWIY